MTEDIFQENTVALQALRQAMRLEQDGYRFYTEAAERTADPRGKEMFLSLADDEKLHLRIVRDQYEALSTSKGWGSFAEALELKPVDVDKPLFPPERGAFEKAIDPKAGNTDALLFALQIENQSYELYRKAAGETADPAGKDMYQRLASYERTHFDILMLNYEHLVSTGSWRGL
jgi:rubrerythrin